MKRKARPLVHEHRENLEKPPVRVESDGNEHVRYRIQPSPHGDGVPPCGPNVFVVDLRMPPMNAGVHLDLGHALPTFVLQ